MTANRALVFPRQVDKAVAAVRGDQVGFAGEDHLVGLLEVAVDTAVDQNTVTVNGRLGCRDWSGTWDDDYGGTIQVSVFAELVSATEPPPRGDIQVTDMEVNQATQFFRAAEHLDAANVRPATQSPWSRASPRESVPTSTTTSSGGCRLSTPLRRAGHHQRRRTDHPQPASNDHSTPSHRDQPRGGRSHPELSHSRAMVRRRHRHPAPRVRRNRTGPEIGGACTERYGSYA